MDWYTKLVHKAAGDGGLGGQRRYRAVRRPPGLFRPRSSTRFQYRCRVPQDLVTRIGQRELKRSLQTADPVVARERALAVGHAAHRLFHAIRQDPLLGPNDIAELMRDFYVQRLDEDVQARAQASAAGIGLAAGGAGLVEARRRQVAGCDVNAIRDPADAFLAARGIRLEPGSSADFAVRFHLLRAELEAARRMLERDQGIFYGEPDEPLLKGVDPFSVHPAPAAAGLHPVLPPARSQAAPVPGAMPAPVDDFEYGDKAELTITAYAEEVVDEKGFDEEAGPAAFDPESRKVIKPKSHALKYRAAARTLAEVIGDKRVRDVKPTDLVRYKDAMRKAPKHYSRAQFETIKQAIAAREEGQLQQPRLSAKTINDGYLSPLREVFRHAVKNHCIKVDPTTGVSVEVSAKEKKRDHEKRDPFEIEDLNQILRAPLFAGARSDYYWHDPGDHHDRSYRFWSPLCMLFMGARPEEIAQIMVNDLEDAGGYPCLRIRTGMSEADRREEQLLCGGGGRNVKSEAAVRTIPIHPVLAAFGLLQLFEDVRERGGRRLFPEWKRACDGRYSNILSKEFNAPKRFLDRVGVKSPTKVLYSFRHNFRDALKETDLDRGEEMLLMGHESGEVSDIYGSRKMYGRLINRFITTFRYGGLDLLQVRDADWGPALKPERVPEVIRKRLERLGCDLDVALGLRESNE